MNLTEALTTLLANGAFCAGRPIVPGSITADCHTGRALLTEPSKMPAFSWSLPAGNKRMGQPEGTCPGARADDPSYLCYLCYANPDSKKLDKHGQLIRRGGNYERRSVQKAQSARHQWTTDCLISKEGQATWVTVMTAAITWATRDTVSERYDAWQSEICHEPYALAPRKPSAKSKRIRYFRWHDSGDVWQPNYGKMIREVCANLPDVRFWLPTRSWHSTPRILTVLQDMAQLPNVAVRPSALRFEETAPVVPGLSAGTGARSAGFNCPAHAQNNECRACRTCWRKDTEVYYRTH